MKPYIYIAICALLPLNSLGQDTKKEGATPQQKKEGSSHSDYVNNKVAGFIYKTESDGAPATAPVTTVKTQGLPSEKPAEKAKIEKAAPVPIPTQNEKEGL